MLSTTQKCNTISFSTVSKHLQKPESKRKSPVKRTFVESKTSTFEPSLSKIKKSVNTEHAYISKEMPDAKIEKLTKILMLCIKKFVDGKSELRI